jgi:hypothetical protein
MTEERSPLFDASGFKIVQVPPDLLNEHYDDRYFDVVNAIEESKHVFFQGSGIMDILSAKGPGRKVLRIGETGFGAGRVLIALLDFLDNCGLTDMCNQYSVELSNHSERMAEFRSVQQRSGRLLICLSGPTAASTFPDRGGTGSNSPGLLAS